MEEAIRLAKLGKGFTNPNPIVGAVIVKDGVILGSGYHQRYGKAHAEVNAIKSAKKNGFLDLSGASIYVTLEPCFHYGKTPPCVDAIIQERFSEVFIGMEDPNSLTAGKSIQKLVEHGIYVEVDLLEEECRELNKGFIKLMQEGKPYTVMKTAMTLDGKIATVSGESKWISGKESRRMVHDLRHELQGIMVGINTVIKDNPSLTARNEENHINPTRIILDSTGRIPLDLIVVQTAKKIRTILFTTDQMQVEKRIALSAFGVEIEVVEEKEKVDLSQVMKRLGDLSIVSVLLEGGGTINDAMLRAGYVDEVISFVAPKLFGGKEATTPVSGEGIKNISDAIVIENMKVSMVGKDVCIRGKVEKTCLQD